MQLFTPYLLPSPAKTFLAGLEMLENKELFIHSFVSLKRIFFGFSLSFLLALFFGTIAGVLPKISVYYEIIIEFFRNIPPISLIAILILWAGIGEGAKVIIIVLASFFPMFLSIQKGLSSCDTKLIEVGKIFGFSKWQIFFKILLPNARKDIFVGMRIGFGYAVRAIIGAEMIAATSGLGYFILDSQELSRSDKIFVGIFAIGILGVFFDRLFLFLIKRFSR